MGMFKTIGMVTGGVLLGVATTVVVNNKCDIINKTEVKVKEKAKEKVKEKAEEVTNAVIEKITDPIDTKNDENHVKDDAQLNKHDLIDKMDEMQDLLYQTQSVLSDIKKIAKDLIQEPNNSEEKIKIEESEVSNESNTHQDK